MDLFLFLLLSLLMIIPCNAASNSSICFESAPRPPPPGVTPLDRDQIQFALNLEFLLAELYLCSSLGYGLDGVAPGLANGGPSPIGCRKANLDQRTRNIIAEFGYQEVGHIRAINSMAGGFPRPQIDISPEKFARFFDAAVGGSPKQTSHQHPFNAYESTENLLLASYGIPYVGLVNYVGINPGLMGYESKRLVAGLLAIAAGQNAVMRTLLYEQSNHLVHPYNLRVSELTARISNYANQLAGCGIKDEGLLVPLNLGAENKTNSNILSADTNSLAYARSPPEVLRIMYGTGDEGIPGGCFPDGANGRIARGFLQAP